MVWAALMVLVLVGLPYPKIFIELDAMLPEDSEITQTIRVSQKLFGPTDYVVIGVTHDDGRALDEAGAAQLVAVQELLLTVPGVRKTDLTSLVSDRARIVTADSGDVQIERILRGADDWRGATERTRRSALFKCLLSNDGRSSLILFRISEPQEGKRVFLKALRTRLDSIVGPGFHVTIGGQPSVFAELERYSQNILFVLPFTLILIGLIHFEAFRSMQGMVFPLITAVASAGVATALMNLVGIRLDGFNTTAPIVIVALTAGHAVQMLKRFNEELVAVAAEPAMSGAGWAAINRLAIERAFVSIAPVMVAASVVAAASFASLIIFKTPVIRTFGLYAALGILAGLIIELVFIPALRLRIPVKCLPLAEQRHSIWDRVVDRLAVTSTDEHRNRTIVVGVVFLALCGGLAAHVKVDNSVEEYFARFTQIRKAERELNERFAGSSVLYLLFQSKGENAIVTAETANLMRRIEAWLLKEPQIGTAVSFADPTAEVACGFDPADCNKSGPLGWKTDAVLQFLELYESGAGVGALDDFLAPKRDAALIRVLSKTDSSLFIDKLFNGLHAEFDSQLPPGVTMLLGGTGATTLALNRKFIESKLANIAQILAIAALVATVLFRSLLMGLLIAVPLFTSTVFAFAVMTLLGIPLNVATVFIAAISVGIGADYAIYFGVRLRDFLRLYEGDVKRATAATYRTAGKAALFVASAVAGGYLGLIASVGYNVHLWLGVMVSAAMLASVTASLTLFPALLLALKPKAIFGAPSP